MLFRDGPTFHEDGLSDVRNQPGEQNALKKALLGTAWQGTYKGVQFSQVGPNG